MDVAWTAHQPACFPVPYWLLHSKEPVVDVATLLTSLAFVRDTPPPVQAAADAGAVQSDRIYHALLPAVLRLTVVARLCAGSRRLYFKRAAAYQAGCVSFLRRFGVGLRKRDCIGMCYFNYCYYYYYYCNCQFIMSGVESGQLRPALQSGCGHFRAAAGSGLLIGCLVDLGKNRF